MAGIYIHIPFCRQACTYCDFYFSTSLKKLGKLVEAMEIEIEKRKNFFGTNTKIDSLYFGGGTPSILNKAALSRLFSALRSCFTLSDMAEVTLEANPEDISKEQLMIWKKLGVNRLSIGIQCFQNTQLKWMNRMHTAPEAINAVKEAQQTGFSNISIDLIYGIPGMSLATWKENVKQAIELSVPHISAYSLTVEPKTLLYHQLNSGKLQLPPDNLVAQQFYSLVDMLEQAGYQHYEISNFSLPGARAQHNSSYWQGKAYLGIGPSAHSYCHGVRSWNIANNAAYIRLLQEGKKATVEEEKLTTKDQINEYIMTGLRQSAGLSLEKLDQLYQFNLLEKEQKKTEEFVKKGWLKVRPGKMILTREGKLFCDYITREFFRI